MAQTDKQLLDALLSKIFLACTGSDSVNNLPAPAKPQMIFLPVGMPVTQNDLAFDFQPNANDVQAASSFATLVNYVPNATGFWSTDTSLIWDVYKRLLDSSILPTSTLSDAEKAKLKAAEELLWRRAPVVDPDTGEAKELLIETPAHAAYKKFQSAYNNALLAYNSILISVQTNPDDPQVIASWTFNGPIYADRVRSAYADWTSNGKGKIEAAIADIDVLQSRSPSTYWLSLKARLRDSLRKDLNGQDYYFTNFMPKLFYQPDHSWSSFGFTRKELHTVDTSTSTSWGGGGSVGWGLWSFGASASYSSETRTSESDAKDLMLKVELCRVPLRRSWLDASLFSSRSWKFDPAIVSDILSDGGSPPTGLMTGVTTELIVARNLQIKLDATSIKDTYAFSQFSTSGKVGWGPFSLRGNYSKSTTNKTHDFIQDGATLSSEGMQIIGFMVQRLPKSPNPDPGLSW